MRYTYTDNDDDDDYYYYSQALRSAECILFVKFLMYFIKL